MGWIFKGIAQVLVGALTSLFGVFAGVIEELDLDFLDGENNAFLMTIGANSIKSFSTLFIAIGIALAFGITLFKLMQTMLGPVSDGEDPGPLAARFIMAVIGVFSSYTIFNMFLESAKIFYDAFKKVGKETMESTPANFFNTNTLSETFSGDDTVKNAAVAAEEHLLGGIGGIVLLITLIACVLLFVNYIKLVLEIFERYVTLAFLFYTCPIAFSTLASKSTKKIFGAWMQMVISEMILMCLNLFFVSTFVTGMANLKIGKGTGEIGSVQSYLISVMILSAWLILGQKADEHLKGLGLATPQTGRGLGAAVLGGAIAAAHTGAAIAGVATHKHTSTSMAGKDAAAFAGLTSGERVAGEGAIATAKKASSTAGDLTKSGAKIALNSSNIPLNGGIPAEDAAARKLASKVSNGAIDRAFPTSNYSLSTNGKGAITATNRKTGEVSQLSTRAKSGALNVGGGLYMPATKEGCNHIAETQAALMNTSREDKGFVPTEGKVGYNVQDIGGVSCIADDTGKSKTVSFCVGGIGDREALTNICDTYDGKLSADNNFIEIDGSAHKHEFAKISKDISDHRTFEI